MARIWSASARVAGRTWATPPSARTTSASQCWGYSGSGIGSITGIPRVEAVQREDRVPSLQDGPVHRHLLVSGPGNVGDQAGFAVGHVDGQRDVGTGLRGLGDPLLGHRG